MVTSLQICKKTCILSISARIVLRNETSCNQRAVTALTQRTLHEKEQQKKGRSGLPWLQRSRAFVGQGPLRRHMGLCRFCFLLCLKAAHWLRPVALPSLAPLLAPAGPVGRPSLPALPLGTTVVLSVRCDGLTSR